MATILTKTVTREIIVGGKYMMSPSEALQGIAEGMVTVTGIYTSKELAGFTPTTVEESEYLEDYPISDNAYVCYRPNDTNADCLVEALPFDLFVDHSIDRY